MPGSDDTDAPRFHDVPEDGSLGETQAHALWRVCFEADTATPDKCKRRLNTARTKTTAGFGVSFMAGGQKLADGKRQIATSNFS